MELVLLLSEEVSVKAEMFLNLNDFDVELEDDLLFRRKAAARATSQ